MERQFRRMASQSAFIYHSERAGAYAAATRNRREAMRFEENRFALIPRRLALRLRLTRDDKRDVAGCER